MRCRNHPEKTFLDAHTLYKKTLHDVYLFVCLCDSGGVRSLDRRNGVPGTFPRGHPPSGCHDSVRYGGRTPSGPIHPRYVLPLRQPVGKWLPCRGGSRNSLRGGGGVLGQNSSKGGGGLGSRSVGIFL